MLVLNVIQESRRRTLELPDRPLLVGSDPGCDLVLPGLDPEHLAIKPAGDGTWLLKVLGPGEVRVGGKPTREAMLHQGDRVELGSVVLEVEVAEHAAEGRAPREPRRKRTAPVLPWGWIGLGCVVLVVYFGYQFYGRGGGPFPADVARVVSRLELNLLDEAEESLAVLRERAKRDRVLRAEVERLAVELADRRRAEAEVERLFGPYWSRREELSIGSLTQALRGFERKAAGDRFLVRAIRRRLSTLADDLLASVGDPSAERALARQADQEARIPVIEVMDRVDVLVRNVRLEAALQLLDQAASEAGSPAAVGDYEARKRSILGDSQQKTLSTVYEAYRLANAGQAQQALDLVLEVKALFPPGGELDRFHRRLTQAEYEIRPLLDLAQGSRRVASASPKAPSSAVPEKPSPAPSKPIDWDEIARERERARPTPGQPGPGGATGLVQQAEMEVARWDFAAAARLYGQVAETFPGAQEQAVLAEARAQFLTELAEAIKSSPEKFKNIRTLDGGRADFLDADLLGISALLDGVAVRMAWPELGVAKVVELGRLTKPEGRSLLGMAAIALDGGLRQEFDQLLQAGLAREPALAGPAEALLRRRTGKQGPFVWLQDRWLPKAEGDLLVRAKEAEKSAQGLFALRDLDERSRGLAEFAARGDVERAAACSVLGARVELLATTIRSHAFFKQLDRAASLRRELDERRKQALELIFDEETYFYPFRAPECPPDKAKLYWPVQQEVNRRIAAVQMVWNRKVTLQIPPGLQALAREAHWVLASLAEQGGRDPAHEEALLDVLLLPLKEGEVTVRNFAWTLRERRQLNYSWRVLRYNLVVEAEPTRAEMEQMAITNDYRLMMGRRALALQPKLLRSTRMHSEEMSRLGYFSHFSPVASNRTPVLRMAREGYNQGVSENIAKGLGPAEAHTAWLHSSGHHRNILNPNHREFASGNHGDLWTQNYGHGTDFETDPLFETE